MRRFLVLGLAAGLLLVALILPPLTGAKKNDKSKKRITQEKLANDKAEREWNPKVQAVRAVNFAVSPTLRELAASQETLSPRQARRTRIKNHEEVIEKIREQSSSAGKEGRVESREQEEILEKNRRNAEIIRKADPYMKTEPDAAIARVPGKDKSMAPRVMTPPAVSFETISLTDTTSLPNQGFLPPDPVGEVGPNHFVQMVNSAFRIYNKSGTPLIPLTSIGTLFGTIPGPCAGNEDGDPIVLYDQLADRWLLSEFCISVANPNNHQLIAISQTGDPTGAYFLYDFMMPNNKFNDYPKFGVWSDGYYMSDNQFNQAGTQFLGGGLFAFDRTKMLAGDPTASYIYFDKAEGCPAACQFGGMLPADIDGFVPPPAGSPAPFIQFDADEFGATDSLRIFDFHADFAVPGNSTVIERTGSPLAVAAFDPREVPSGSRNNIPQPTGAAVDVISDRLMNRLAYRNYGTHESIAVNHSVNAAVNPQFRAGVRYYEIRKTSPVAGWTVHEQGTMAGDAGDTTHRWMGSAAMNAAGSLAVGYSASSTTVFPAIRYAGRLAEDPPGSLAQGEAVLVAGTSSQSHSSGRWGDYSSLTVDPVDDCTFWYTQQYITGSTKTGRALKRVSTAPDNTRWHTRVGAFQFGPCPAVQKGALNGTIISSAGGVPIANATVSAGPFVRSSRRSGAYNIDPVGSGTYTVTVSAFGYETASVPGVTITTGNTTTQNVQLIPVNILQPGNVVVTAESCAPSNSALDPGETVTVNLAIVNNGGLGASTANLVATLQATGGVSSPSGPQAYGAVAQGASAVVRPYTFTVSTTCGSFVDMTLQLQDGATNLGTIVYRLRTGTLGVAVPATYTTGNIATPIPDVSSVDVPIVVAQNGAVADINVRVRLNHTFTRDLTLTLISPSGTQVVLAANEDTAAGGGDNYGTDANDCSGTPTIFDDAAPTSITTADPPFAGTFQPESPLSLLNGEGIGGTWKLRVVDEAGQDIGTVGCVTLDINRQPFVCCGVSGAPVMEPGAATVTAESLTPANNAPDPGETITAAFPLLNTGDGNTASLVATMQTSGGVTPVTPVRTYGVVVAGGAPVSQPFTFVANGVCGDNITATLQLQDGAINLGTVTYTFRLGTTNVSTQIFTNGAPIGIPATGTGIGTGAPSNPYPSAITVAGISNPVSRVTVALNQMTHTFPGDVDVLLVGPTGVKFVLMSDVIGDDNWTGQTYTFDDAAAELLPATGAAPPTGIFKPTNYDVIDAFPVPAPPPPYLHPATASSDTLASAFNGVNPNGIWNLYVVDDAGTDVGAFAGGWQLAITTTQSVCNTQSCAITCPSSTTVPADSGGVSAVVNYPPETPGGACGVLDYNIPSGSTFPLGTTIVTASGNGGVTCSFGVTVTGPVDGKLIILGNTLSAGSFDQHKVGGWGGPGWNVPLLR